MYLIDKGTEYKENSNAGEDDTIKKRKKNHKGQASSLAVPRPNTVALKKKKKKKLSPTHINWNSSQKIETRNRFECQNSKQCSPFKLWKTSFSLPWQVRDW